MTSEVLRLLRYNTGNDKKVFVNFKDNFDAVIFNASIVAHSGSAIADLVSVHKNQYIIDPQTHIFQHDLNSLQPFKKKGHELKTSIQKYFDELPKSLTKIILTQHRPLQSQEVLEYVDDLCASVYKFETEFVNNFIKTKEYDKYLEFAGKKPEPKLIIAPYFMIKKEYMVGQVQSWMKTNQQCLEKFIRFNNSRYEIAAQLVIDKEILVNEDILEKIINAYDLNGFNYIFIWIDEFSSFYAQESEKIAFKTLLEGFTRIGKKAVMSYGGYDSIILCNSGNPNRVYGVAQSIGYGESRPITPVGGGLPTNKYYFYPIHKRIKFSEAADILSNQGYFDKQKLASEYAQDYFDKICSCEQCKTVIKDNIDNFNLYNDTIPFYINGKYGKIARNRPTTDASFISAMHFMQSKVREWDEIKYKSYEEILSDLQSKSKVYSSNSDYENILQWCEIYAE